MNCIDKLKEVSAFLKSSGIEYAAKDAEIILMETLQINKPKLYTADSEISDEMSRHIDSLAERRAGGEPLQYIIGHVDFCGLNIKVGPGVLIPRPETELLVVEVLKTVTSNELRVTSKNSGQDSGLLRHSSLVTRSSPLSILDLCTGSGCLALAIAKHIPDSDVYAVDISEKALEYARENAKFNGIANVKFLKGNLFEAVKGMRFDIIVSNPPYIKRSDINNLQPEIRGWEPLDALDGGEDGLRFYREILPLSAQYLNSNGCLIVEMGYGEHSEIVRIAEGSGVRGLSVIKDYSGIERVLHLSF